MTASASRAEDRWYSPENSVSSADVIRPIYCVPRRRLASGLREWARRTALFVLPFLFLAPD